MNYSKSSSSSTPDFSATGFTLIEMSIVLVIIALLVGGVLVGASMIRDASVRTILKDIDGFSTAARAFRGKYNCLPGDCSNASTFFTGLANGNGNGEIDYGVCKKVGDYTQAGNIELFLFWQQLGAAGLLPSTYSGLPGSGSPYNAVIGVNGPPSRVAGGGYSLINWPGRNGGGCDPYYMPAGYPNAIEVGAATAGDRTVAPILTSLEALGIDVKIDDGLPGAGRVMTYTQFWLDAVGYPECVLGNDASATYNMAVTTTACTIMFNKSY